MENIPEKNPVMVERRLANMENCLLNIGMILQGSSELLQTGETAMKCIQSCAKASETMNGFRGDGFVKAPRQKSHDDIVQLKALVNSLINGINKTVPVEKQSAMLKGKIESLQAFMKYFVG